MSEEVLTILKEIEPLAITLINAIIAWIITEIKGRKKSLEKKLEKIDFTSWSDRFDLILDGKKYPLSQFHIERRVNDYETKDEKKRR